MFAAGKTAGASSGNTVDAQFNYVTMLLHGDGTNGAQNNTFLDSSSNNYTVTRTGNVSQGSFSPYGSNWGMYQSDVNGSLLSFTTSVGTSFQFAGDFTIEGWVYYTSSSGDASFYVISDNTNYLALNISMSAGVYNIYLNSGSPSVSFSHGISLNTWTHVAMVRSGSTVTLYTNGVSKGTTTNSATLGYSSPVINRTGGGVANVERYISNIRVVKSAVYTSNFTPSTTPLTAIANTSLLTCQSNRFVDNSTNNFTATVSGSPSVQRFNPFGTATAYSTSTIGGSGYFNGTAGNYLRTTGTVGIANSAFTICCWFYPLNSSVIGLFDSATVSVGTFRNYSANKIEDQTQSGGAVNFAGAYQVNAWNWMCITKSGSSFTVYINGSSVGTGTDYITLAESTFTVGGINNGADGPYYGYISDFQVLNTATVVAVPTTPITNASGKTYLLKFQNAGIFDNAMMNNLETVGNAQISTSVVKYGTGSLYFDGSGDGLFARSTADTAFNTGDFTVEFWIYLAANLSNFVKIVELGASGNCLTIETQSTTNVLNVTNLTSTVYLTSNTALTNNTWIHVAVTRASGTLRIFQNGTSVGGVSNSTDFPNSGGIYIGQSNTGQAMNGYIDDLRITKGYARYTANFTPPTAAFPNTGPN